MTFHLPLIRPNISNLVLLRYISNNEIFDGVLESNPALQKIGEARGFSSDLC